MRNEECGMRNEGGGFAAIFRETLIKSLSEQT